MSRPHFSAQQSTYPSIGSNDEGFHAEILNTPLRRLGLKAKCMYNLLQIQERE
jgi:hypothetical protein